MTTDTTAPVLTSLSIPKTVDLSKGIAGLTISGLATDDNSGVSQVFVYLDKPLNYGSGNSSSSFNTNSFFGLWGWDDSWSDGASSSTYMIGTTNTSGTYRVTQVSIRDVQGNSRIYSQSELGALGINTTISVTGTSMETSAAKVTTVQSNGQVVVTLEPSQWTVGSNSAQFSVLFNSSDYSFVSAQMVGSGASSSTSIETVIGNPGSATVFLSMSNGSTSGQFQILFAPNSSTPGAFSATMSSYLFNNVSSQLQIPSLLNPDFLVPTISVSSSETKLKVGDTAQVIFSLSEASADFTVSDITVKGGTISNFSGSGTTYSATFTMSALGATGSVSVKSNSFSDTVGNMNTDGADANNVVTFMLSNEPVTRNGSANADTLMGGLGDDIFTGGGGDDLLQGGDGTDTAVYRQSARGFTLKFAGSDVVLTDTRGIEGTDRLTAIEILQFSDKTVIVELKSHASYAALPAELYQFFITAFNAAPGVTYMDQLAEAYNYGLSVKEIVDIFTTKPQFTSVYAPTLSNQELANQLVNNIIKTSATAEARASAVNDIKAALDIGWTVGKVIFQVFGNLAKMPLTDPFYGNTTKQFNNQIAVAKYYTDTLNQSTTDMETLKDIVQSVSSSTDVSTDAAIAQLIGVALLTGGLAA